MNAQQVMAELGRLHMENLALRAEIEELRRALAEKMGAASVVLSAPESEPEGPGDEPEPDAG